MTLCIILRFIYEAYFRFPHFKIVRAGMKRWMNNSNETLVTYQIRLKTKKSSGDLIFNEVWIDDKKYKYTITREDRKLVNAFSKKEVLQLSVVSEGTNDPHSSPPKLNNKGLLIAYTFRDKKKFLSVKKLKDIGELHLSSF